MDTMDPQRAHNWAVWIREALHLECGYEADVYYRVACIKVHKGKKRLRALGLVWSPQEGVGVEDLFAMELEADDTIESHREAAADEQIREDDRRALAAFEECQ